MVDAEGDEEASDVGSDVGDAEIGRSRQESESGMTTAELLGNAALGIAALVAIWALLQALGVNVINWIEGQLGI